MKNQLNVQHGANTEYHDGLLVQHWNPIGVIKNFVARTRSEIIADVAEIPPQNVRMPKRPSIDAATLAARDLMEALKI